MKVFGEKILICHWRGKSWQDKLKFSNELWGFSDENFTGMQKLFFLSSDTKLSDKFANYATNKTNICLIFCSVDLQMKYARHLLNFILMRFSRFDPKQSLFCVAQRGKRGRKGGLFLERWQIVWHFSHETVVLYLQTFSKHKPFKKKINRLALIRNMKLECQNVFESIRQRRSWIT